MFMASAISAGVTPAVAEDWADEAMEILERKFEEKLVEVVKDETGKSTVKVDFDKLFSMTPEEKDEILRKKLGSSHTDLRKVVLDAVDNALTSGLDDDFYDAVDEVFSKRLMAEMKLAQRIGCSVATVERWKKRKNAPPWIMKEVVLKFFSRVLAK